MNPGQRLNGFSFKKELPLPELRAAAQFFEHDATGAKLLRLHAPQDPECLFAIAAPTPPPDDTGLPHIMEHSLLAGSKRFPVKEPFFELVKISMATFINAMTYQAHTAYPVSSAVHKDYLNLAQVYLDAFFHPLLEEDTLSREGHHLAPANPDDPDSALTVNGIVYNEMKGVYSTPEHYLFEIFAKQLSPDTPLGKISGGDPDFIPELSYKQFLDFYRDYYHPSNSLMLVYGDIAIEKLLPLIEESLKGFSKGGKAHPMPRQPRWNAPRKHFEKYQAGSETELKQRTFYALAWLCGDALNPDEVVAWNVLSKILLGNDAAPLKKAIIDSKLGADLCYSGANEHAYEETFLVTLKGSEPGRGQDFEALVLKTLQKLADGEFEEAAVRAAVNQLRYEFQEIKPLHPIHVMNLVNSVWPYGGDPLAFLDAAKTVEKCEESWLKDRKLFNKLIGKGLVENQHRLLIELAPDLSVAAEREKAFSEKMAAVKAGLSQGQLKEIAAKAAALKAKQTEPNSPEKLATLPQLKRSDLPEKPSKIPFSTSLLSGSEILRAEVFSNGVNYLELDVDMDALPDELLELLPLYCDLFAKAGVDGQAFDKVAKRRAASTGGLWAWPSATRHASESGRSLKRLRFGMKALDAQADSAFPLLSELVLGLDPRDGSRLREIIVQRIAALRSALVNGGNMTAAREAAKGLSPEALVDWKWNNAGALRRLESLERGFEQESEPLIGRLLAIREFIRAKASWSVSFAGSDKAFALLPALLAARPQTSIIPAKPQAPFARGLKIRRALAAPLQIAHCAEAMPGLSLAHPDAPLLQLAAYIGTFDYMLPFIRFKGNAYGANLRLGYENCALVLSSFRDPHIVETVSVFEGLRDFFAKASWSELDIERAVIGSMKDAVKPLRPAEAANVALSRRLRGETDELRERRHAALLAATPEKVKDAVLRHLDSSLQDASVCVISSREKIEAANKELGSNPLEIVELFD